MGLAIAAEACWRWSVQTAGSSSAWFPAKGSFKLPHGLRSDSTIRFDSKNYTKRLIAGTLANNWSLRTSDGENK